MRRAVFLDRDGTIIEHVHHLTDSGGVRLLPGVAESIYRLQSHGYLCVVVTNQSVIGRGMLTAAGLEQIHLEVTRQLAQYGVAMDGWYYCPFSPTQNDPTVIEHSDRKPGPGMIKRASKEMSINVNESWMVGDSISDILAGKNAGCHGAILLLSSAERASPDLRFVAHYTASDLSAATDLILGQTNLEQQFEKT